MTTEEFIMKARGVHGDKYDYSEVDYVNNHTKICMICPEHGRFYQMPMKHLSGQGCPECGKLKSIKGRRMSTEDFIEKAHKVHGDKYDYSKVVYAGMDVPVEIMCPEHGAFMQMPRVHLSGSGCAKCSEKRMSTEGFIRRAREVHGDKYDYSKTDYTKSSDKVVIICPIHGEYQQDAWSHLNGCGCPKCARGSKALGREEFIARAKKIHGDKYDYSKVEYVNNHTKVCIICPEHGEFWQAPSKHLIGRGCQVCGGSQRSNTSEFIAKAYKIHGDKYDYSRVTYDRNKTKVCIVCPEHGAFWQSPEKHLDGCGCPKCGTNSAAEKRIVSQDEIIERFQQVHGDKYDYSKVEYERSDKNVEIICPIHGSFWQNPYNHMKGCGCPKCASEKTKSQAEEDIASFVKSLVGEDEVMCNTRSVIPPLELDIYVPSLNIAIEYNGLYWHSEAQGKDKWYHLNKLRTCNEKGIRLIQIFEDEWIERKDVVLCKIAHILHKDNSVPKVMARKCQIAEINKSVASSFLDKYHIQGHGQATVSLGCFHNEELIAVMTFKREHMDGDTWELTRFASVPSVVCQGCGGKLFKHFLRAYRPSEVKSFADRRWTVSKDDNLYTKLGFELDEELRPEYRYVVGCERRHKFGFRKQILHKKYGMPLDMTEKEMTDALGFERIWDCGLFKYIWKEDSRD